MGSFSVFLLALSIFNSYPNCYAHSDLGLSPRACDSENGGYQCNIEYSHFWGHYSPYFRIRSDPAIRDQLPSDCTITMVQVLSRHGARYPVENKRESYYHTIRKIRAANAEKRLQGIYEFLNLFIYNPENVNLQTGFGAEQMRKSGRKLYKTYQNLAKDNQPFTRSPGKERIHDAAREFLQGFNEAKGIAPPTPDTPSTSQNKDTLITIDVVFRNQYAALNPLLPSTCAAFEKSRRSVAISQILWAEKFALPIKTRLNRDLRGAKLKTADVINLMDLCPLESVASPQFDEGYLSPFCKLFTLEEWKDYDYYHSLGKWYSFGAGSFLGPTQGVGFSNELLARLKNEKVNDHTSTNQEINRDESYFPLGKKIYADFSSDNQITTILAALGIYNTTKSLSPFRRQDPIVTKGYTASYTVPFAARIYFEKIECRADNVPWVRGKINDRIVPLSFCPRDLYGRCPLNIFSDKLDFVRNGGHWPICFSKRWRLYQPLKLW